MKTGSLASLVWLLGSGLVVAAAVLPPEAQIAAALLAAPSDRRNGATVLGYDATGGLVTLRKGTNDLVCLSDSPGNEGFSVACYHQDLEPFMARGRELAGKGIGGRERDEMRWKEIQAGTLKMSREPRVLYILTGKGFDPGTRQVTEPYLRWVIYTPYATPESTGLSTAPLMNAPWLMNPGTAGAHIMINPTPAKP